MDYRRYCFRREEYIRYGLEAAGLSMVIAFCFYNSPVALILGIPVAFWYFREKRKKLSERRKAALKLQFKDAGAGNGSGSGSRIFCRKCSSGNRAGSANDL